nr:ornithine cyclodeaminase [uncultured Roseovarius sp.]
MQMIDANEVHARLPYDALIPALTRFHEGRMPMAVTHVEDDPAGSANRFVTLPGWMADTLIVVKMVGVFPGNRDRNPPLGTVLGAVAAFDVDTGAPVLVADGEAMTYRKTAAISGVGASLLAPPAPRELLVVGAGGLAWHAVMAHRAARPSLTRVRIWNRTAERAEALAATLRDEGLAAEVAPDLDSAVACADVISCVTMSTVPLVRGALLKPGAHLDLIGAYLPHMREADDDAMRRGRLYTCSSREWENIGELALPVASGALKWSDIRGDLFQLVQGNAEGRQSRDDITVFKNLGGVHQDIFTTVFLRDVLAQG